MQHSIIFFDGVCNLCNGAVQFIIKREHKDIFRFAPLQSEISGKYLGVYNLQTSEITSLILLENGNIYRKSTAVLKISGHLGGLWPLFQVFLIVPRFIRDQVYDMVARNRYWIWGKSESCIIPTPELKRKFL